MVKHFILFFHLLTQNIKDITDFQHHATQANIARLKVHLLVHFDQNKFVKYMVPLHHKRGDGAIIKPLSHFIKKGKIQPGS